MIKKVTLFISSSLLLVANEPSAFGAGDLNSSNPYGLTDTEKYIYENKKKLSTAEDNLQRLKTQTRSTNTRLNDIESSIDGIKSIMDSEGQKTHKQSLEIKKLSEEILKGTKAIEIFDTKLKESVSKQEEDLKKIVEENNKNVEKLEKLIKELSTVVASISANYVSKEQYDALAKDTKGGFDDYKKIIDDLKATHKKDIDSLKALFVAEMAKMTVDSKKPAEVLEEAIKLYESKEYDKAYVMFESLVEKKHKPARSTYYLAQIEFDKKDYAKALKLYNKSVELYDKADYMPEILFNSGVCYMNLKDNKNAKNFFNALITSFPKYKDVDKAKKILSGLKDNK
jgi:TolA-binding protein